MFCKHEWKVLSETVTKSSIESVLQATKDAGLTLGNYKGGCSDRKHIQTFACSKCGKFKRFVENI